VVAYAKEKLLKFELGLYSDGATMLQLARAISARMGNVLGVILQHALATLDQRPS